LAGGKTPRATDGISVVPTLLGSRTQRRHEYLYWELPRRDARDRWAYRREIPRQAIRMGNWKAVRPEPDGRLELYNLARDPGETANVASANPEVLARMEALLKTARTTPRPAVPFEDRWRKAAP
jgi:arylsulfatase A-like enzyme